ncbi:MAG: diphthamide biosynthesis enzyme Dph2 [Candidatus Bathyarchaeota archaeon]|nr:diphthamide biosynthesis enzyme Dph2 [Candidatus Bathyarchaeota archaeon]
MNDHFLGVHEMKRDSFGLEESWLKEEILKRGAKRVLVQLPEGLKPEGPRLAAVIEQVGATAIISADPCYGACDLPLYEAESLGADLIVHYGHTELVKNEEIPVPTIYMEAKANVDVKTAVEKAIEQLEPWTRIGLATTVQHIHMLSEARKILEEAGKMVYIGGAGQTKYSGQVLGCNYSNVKAVSDRVEAFLFVGGGRFHALGLYLATMKPTIVADPFEKRAYSIDADAQKIVRRRWAEISEAKEARNFGVVIGLKPGQRNIEAALNLKEALEKRGKTAVLLALREITASALLQFPTIDAYVNTACPRIALNESSFFMKPVLTAREANVVLGKVEWEDLLKEGLI